MIEQARQALSQGDLDAAKLFAADALAANPDDEAAKNLLGMIAVKQSDFAEARRIFAELLADNSEDVNLNVNMGLACLKSELYDDAKGYLKTALKTAPEHKSAHNYLGLTFSKLGDYENAIISFDQSGNAKMAKKMREKLAKRAAGSGQSSTFEFGADEIDFPVPKGTKVDSGADAEFPVPKGAKGGDDDDAEFPVPKGAKGGDDDDAEFPVPKGAKGGDDDDAEFPVPKGAKGGDDDDAEFPVPKGAKGGDDDDAEFPVPKGAKGGDDDDAEFPVPKGAKGGDDDEAEFPVPKGAKGGDDDDAEFPVPKGAKGGGDDEAEFPVPKDDDDDKPAANKKSAIPDVDDTDLGDDLGEMSDDDDEAPAAGKGDFSAIEMSEDELEGEDDDHVLSEDEASAEKTPWESVFQVNRKIGDRISSFKDIVFRKVGPRGTVIEAPDGSLLVHGGEEPAYLKLDAAKAIYGEPELDRARMRLKGEEVSKKFGAEEDPFYSFTGDGVILMKNSSLQRIAAIQLTAKQIIYAVEEKLCLIGQGVSYENGKVAHKTLAEIDLVQLRGPGVVAVTTIDTMLSLPVSKKDPVFVDVDSLIGWTGALIPTLMYSPVDEGQVVIKLVGDGVIII